MKYFEGKDWRYHVKSAAITFISVFLMLFAVQLNTIDASTLTPADVTWEGIVAAAAAFVRMAVVAAVQALLTIVRK